ncbi:hypothetical protein X777_06744, partial [Ooceraea biroi]
QKVTPKIKRSKSFPNESETTDRAAELEDMLSSRSGITETSTNKPEVDEDEEEEQWKDASPLTPICSPARRPAKLHHRDKRSPTRYVDVDNDVEIIHEFYPTTSKTMLEETSIVSYGGTIIVETTRIPRHTKDVAARMEKVGPKVKLKKQASLELDRVPPVQEEPSSSAEEVSRVTATMKSLRETEKAERRKSLKRHSSVESEGRTSTSRETLERSDTSSEKGAKKKVFTEKEEAKSERKLEEESSRRRLESLEDEPYRRTREERKSLKEQECIERVTEFLTRHSIPSYPDMSLVMAEITVPEVVDEQSEQRVKRPSVIGREEKIVSPPTVVETSIASTKRKESLKSVPETVEETKDSRKDSKTTAKDTKRLSESKRQRPILERTTTIVPDAQQSEPAVQEPVKRPSSLRKRRDSFSRESSRESLLEEKKGVRIQEDVQEIFFEDTSDQVTDLLPEVQLVTARIITAEEASASASTLRFEEATTRIEIYSPPEVAVVSETVKARLMRAPSPEVVDVASTLQLPALAKSTSETTLTEEKLETAEDHKISVRNLKPEILLDLSKMSDNGEEIEETGEDGREVKERRLSRTGSEGSKRLAKGQKQEEFPFTIGSLAQPDRPHLTILHESLTGSVGDIPRKITAEDAKESAASR